MTPYRWMRNHARRFVDWCHCSSAAGIERLGDNDSGWVIQTQPPPLVAYCAGVGKGISFETALAAITERPVLVVDPSPTGVATMAALGSIPNLVFKPVGLCAERGTVRFAMPRDAGEGSYSIAQDDLPSICFECWDLAAMMEAQGDSTIDLLKMDIEGFEFDIVDSLLEKKMRVRQVCIEFHPWLAPGRKERCLRGLKRAGYKIIYKHYGDYTFLLQ